MKGSRLSRAGVDSRLASAAADRGLFSKNGNSVGGMPSDERELGRDVRDEMGDVLREGELRGDTKCSTRLTEGVLFAWWLDAYTYEFKGVTGKSN